MFYSRSLLFIHFKCSSVYTSIPNYPFPPSFRLATISSFSQSVSLFLLSLVAQTGKNPPVVWETWVWSLSWEDPLEKGKATHSSILAGKIHGQRSLWAAVHRVTESRTWLSNWARMQSILQKASWGKDSVYLIRHYILNKELSAWPKEMPNKYCSMNELKRVPTWEMDFNGLLSMSLFKIKTLSSY